MSEVVGRAALLANRIPEEEYEVPGVGKIRIRALTREEAMQVSAKTSMVDRERFILVCAMVDPEMDYKDVTQWQQMATPGELEAVTNRVAELSGMLEGQAKEITQRFPEQSG